MIERWFGSSAAANDLRLLNAPSPVDFIVHVLLPNAFYTCYGLGGGGVTKLKDSEGQNIFFQYVIILLSKYFIVLETCVTDYSADL